MAPPLKEGCKYGHKFTPENTRYVKLTSGYKVRACRQCRRNRDCKRYWGDPVYQAAKRARENLRNHMRRSPE